MKKICFITTVSITLKAFVLKTAEYIHNNTDWEIYFICNKDDEFAAGLPKYIHYLPVNMERGISISGVKAMLEMRSIFVREKFDLIQYSTPNASFYAALAGWLANVPVRLYCQWGIAYVGFNGIKRKIFKSIEKIICNLSTWIEPDSYSNLRFAHEEGLYPKTKGSVIWNGSACGVDLSKFDIANKSQYRQLIREKFHIPHDAFLFGYVGRITRDKGVNELLESFKSIDEDCYLMMVGPSEVDNTINQDLYKWSLNSDRVIYTGYTNCVEQYLSAMDCYILPSYREGFGMGVVEAEAMGVPVIVTNIPGPIDAMENHRTGLTVPMKNEKELHLAMRWIMENTVITQQYSRESVPFVREKFEQNRLLKCILEDRLRLLKYEKQSGNMSTP